MGSRNSPVLPLGTIKPVFLKENSFCGTLPRQILCACLFSPFYMQLYRWHFVCYIKSLQVLEGKFWQHALHSMRWERVGLREGEHKWSGSGGFPQREELSQALLLTSSQAKNRSGNQRPKIWAKVQHQKPASTAKLCTAIILCPFPSNQGTKR